MMSTDDFYKSEMEKSYLIIQNQCHQRSIALYRKNHYEKR